MAARYFAYHSLRAWMRWGCDLTIRCEKCKRRRWAEEVVLNCGLCERCFDALWEMGL